MSLYKYYAIIEPGEPTGYDVTFPDLEGCFTCGDTLVDAVLMAEEVLGLYLSVLEDDNEFIPRASPAFAFVPSQGQSIVLIEVNTDDVVVQTTAENE